MQPQCLLLFALTLLVLVYCFYLLVTLHMTRILTVNFTQIALISFSYLFSSCGLPCSQQCILKYAMDNTPINLYNFNTLCQFPKGDDAEEFFGACM